MKRCRVFTPATLLILKLIPHAFAIDPTGEPGYFTDIHGSVAVNMCFDAIDEDAPQVRRYWKGSLDWLAAIAEKEPEGGLRWPWLSNAIAGHPASGVRLSWIFIHPFTKGYVEFQDPKYLTMAKGAAARTIRKFTATGTPYGPGYRPDDPREFRWEITGLKMGLYTAIAMYELGGIHANRKYQQYLPGVLRYIRATGIEEKDKEGRPMISWVRKDGATRTTGVCHGTAGMINALYLAYEVMPAFRYPDGRSILDLAFHGLNFLAETAIREDGGLTWRDIRHYEGYNINIGRGSGTSGIGAQFLAGYHFAGASHKPVARTDINTLLRVHPHAAPNVHQPEAQKRYLEIAEATARRITLLLEAGYKPRRFIENATVPVTREDMRRQPESDASQYGFCGGMSYAGVFLADMAGVTENAQWASRYRKAAARIGERILANKKAQPIGCTWEAGTKFGVHCSNIALDYGLTGMVPLLKHYAEKLGEAKYLQTALDGAACLISQAVPEKNGYKWAQIVPLDETGRLGNPD